MSLLCRQKNLRILRKTGHSSFPLIDSGDSEAIKGIVLMKDLHAAMLDGDMEPWTALAQYVCEPLIVPETQRVSKLFELMHERRAHMAFMVDEYGQMTGVVTLEDLLEEIVGEIHDETDGAHAEPPIQKTGDATWETDGLITRSDFE